MALNSRIIPLQSPDLVFKSPCEDVLVYAIFSLRINVEVKKIIIHISNVEGNNEAHISKLFRDMFGKYLRICDKAKLKTKFHLAQAETEPDSVNKIIHSFQITFFNFKESGLTSLISCLSTLRSTQCLVLAILKCKVDSNQKGAGSRNVYLEVYKTDLCS